VTRLLGAVLRGVMLAGMAGMLVGVGGVSRRRMGMVSRLLMVARFLVLGRFGMVFSRFGVMGGGVLVTFGCFLRHGVGVL